MVCLFGFFGGFVIFDIDVWILIVFFVVVDVGSVVGVRGWRVVISY